MTGDHAATTTTTALVSEVSVVTVLGELTAREWKQVSREVLQQERIAGSRGTVLDLSAMRCMDSTDIDMLCQLLQVARLVGHPMVVAELRPAVVATLVQLGLHLRPEEVAGTVEDAIGQLRDRYAK